MLGELLKLCLLIATLAAGSAEGWSACKRGQTWWDRERGACIPCTRCEPNLAVKIPCELHRDTTCQSLQEIHIWPFNIIKNNASEPSDYEYYDYEDYGEVSDDEGVVWDVQTTTLTLAASGCVVFFAVVLYLSFYHSKQWKVLKQALRSGTLKTTKYLDWILVKSYSISHSFHLYGYGT